MDNKEKLNEQNKLLLKVSENIMKSGNYSVHNLDFYILSIIKRTISLNEAFVLLLENKNSFTAISIVRLQLDNALRLNAIKVVDDRNDFLNHFFEGKPINKYKIKKQKLTDKFLATELDKKISGVLKLYEYLCDFVHFSNKHFEATKIKSKNKEALFRVSIGNSNILKKKEVIFYENIIKISNFVVKISDEWIKNKNNLLKN